MAKQLAFVYDQAKCTGCQACEANCKAVWSLPTGVRYRQVTATALTGTPAAARPYLSMACNHCSDPVCARVCPVQAFTKMADGAVVQDHSKCIGCKRCIVACPYGSPQWGQADKKAQKCHFCEARLTQGGTPACVEGCPTGALTYIDLATFDSQNPQFAKVVPDPLLLGPSFRVIPASALHDTGTEIKGTGQVSNGGITGDNLKRIKTE